MVCRGVGGNGVIGGVGGGPLGERVHAPLRLRGKGLVERPLPGRGGGGGRSITLGGRGRRGRGGQGLRQEAAAPGAELGKLRPRQKGQRGRVLLLLLLLLLQDQPLLRGQVGILQEGALARLRDPRPREGERGQVLLHQVGVGEPGELHRGRGRSRKVERRQILLLLLLH